MPKPECWNGLLAAACGAVLARSPSQMVPLLLRPGSRATWSHHPVGIPLPMPGLLLTRLQLGLKGVALWFIVESSAPPTARYHLRSGSVN